MSAGTHACALFWITLELGLFSIVGGGGKKEDNITDSRRAGRIFHPCVVVRTEQGFFILISRKDTLRIAVRSPIDGAGENLYT